MHPLFDRVIIGSDHAAFEMKEQIKPLLETLGVTVEDIGPSSADSVDYPLYGKHVAKAVSDGAYPAGILMCGTGQGMCMVANKFRHVRAALCNDLFSAIMSRRHNNANILVMGGRMVGRALAEEIVRTWLNTPFEGGRHQRRIEQFDDTGK